VPHLGKELDLAVEAELVRTKDSFETLCKFFLEVLDECLRSVVQLTVQRWTVDIADVAEGM
jgi:hypothetical protein